MILGLALGCLLSGIGLDRISEAGQVVQDRCGNQRNGCTTFNCTGPLNPLDCPNAGPNPPSYTWAEQKGFPYTPCGGPAANPKCPDPLITTTYCTSTGKNTSATGGCGTQVCQPNDTSDGC